jgi:hypothetical protein
MTAIRVLKRIKGIPSVFVELTTPAEHGGSSGCLPVQRVALVKSFILLRKSFDQLWLWRRPELRQDACSPQSHSIWGEGSNPTIPNRYLSTCLHASSGNKFLWTAMRPKVFVLPCYSRNVGIVISRAGIATFAINTGQSVAAHMSSGTVWAVSPIPDPPNAAS